MQREIKIRMWNAGGNNMMYDIQTVYECLKQQLSFDKSQPIRNSHWVPPYNHVGDGSVFMQSTGMKGVDEKELWEDDIIKDIGCELIYHIKYGHHYMDGFDRIGFYTVCLNSKNEIGPLGLMDEGQFEVIGNMYENPELINK